jgi:hypothetical protein
VAALGVRRFGTLLVATGVVIFLATLAEVSSPQIHAIGRIFGLVAEPLLIYLILTSRRADCAAVSIACWSRLSCSSR